MSMFEFHNIIPNKTYYKLLCLCVPERIAQENTDTCRTVHVSEVVSVGAIKSYKCKYHINS